ncbi:winged helix-turn-helix domain-containing protein [Enterobacteriaceae bacterium 4M9]|nr:winged helix-turn-helix domain-containing protein [Enterobacteriaceae bacterium 4M9]
MTYNLEDRLFYRAEDGCVWGQDNIEQKLTLPPTSNRLLTLLIEKQGEVVLRDEIYHKVWESFYLEPSGNSLNNHISQLRKVISNHGIQDEVITTIPRIGFTIKSHIKIEHLKEKINVNRVAPPLMPPPKPHKDIMSWSPARFVIIILFFTASVFVLKRAIDNLLPNIFTSHIPVTEQVVRGKCEAWYLEDTTQKKSVIPPEVLVLIEKKYSISCDEQYVLFLHINNNVIFNQPGNVFASRCHRNGPGKVENCRNILLKEFRYR